MKIIQISLIFSNLVIATEILEHFDSLEKAISEFSRVSKEYCIFSVTKRTIFQDYELFKG